ncbi:GNAT family Acetyltransferase [Thecamonas trahens ATCC 50062]|uniref:GNAT family Acetyltransferase n=1 Tax=Thecamonas trahens ATCC 50062 TaxID=461836 RepID=A0A0L0DW71_THETB|nr:GNAT family Acetyltransferase [Thecamonas trahens ATCC 50062]KNC55768.1 GNAT family Acetyltransferase [Thecamonas trahens ATCC 50062]|eukprot:XP_013752851.1 GNAT family Acetyltransferase [Thecamonas trahens ATCC 50062]
MAATVTTRRATLSDTPILLRVIEWAYRGGAPVSGWTGEEHLVSGPRITQDELEADISAALAADAHHVILVAEDSSLDNETCADRFGSSVVGCVKVEKLDRVPEPDDVVAEAEVGLFAVDPTLQGRGAGGILLAQAEAAAVDVLGASHAVIHVLNVRDDILAWYDRKGYVANGKTMPFPPPGVASRSKLKPAATNVHFIELTKPLLPSEP